MSSKLEGPWHFIEGQSGHVVRTETTHVICDVEGWPESADLARLIAAAPDLLEAANWAFLRLMSFYSFYGTDDHDNAKSFAALSAAIAKATGAA